MDGTIEWAKKVGYTEEQAVLIGKMDDLFEEAIRLGLVSDVDAIRIGAYVGNIMKAHTGKKF